MNKAQLIKRVAEKLNVTVKDTALVIDTAIAEIIASLEDLTSVRISGFGNFNVKRVPEKAAKNPFDKESEIRIPAHKKISFKVSETLKERLKED